MMTTMPSIQRNNLMGYQFPNMNLMAQPQSNQLVNLSTRNLGQSISLNFESQRLLGLQKQEEKIQWHIDDESDEENRIKIEEDSESIEDCQQSTQDDSRFLSRQMMKNSYSSSDFIKQEQVKYMIPQKPKKSKSYQDTKNVPKNFGKAIMKYIKENQESCQRLLGSEFEFINFYRRITSKKDKIISIKQFKTLFDDSTINLKNETIKDLDTIKLYNKIYRTMAFKFLQTEFQAYLYANKKIKHLEVMNKYKTVLEEGLKNPSKFISWKQSQEE